MVSSVEANNLKGAAFAAKKLRLAEDNESTEGALRKAEIWFEATLRSLGEAVIATDAEGRVKFMNSVAEQLTGWSSEQALGRRVEEVFQIINEKSRKSVDDPVSKVIRSGTIVGLANHTVLVGRDGREFPIDDSGAPIRDEDGNLVGVVLVFRNIAARHRTEQALRESEERFRCLSGCSPLGIFTTDTHGRWTYANSRAIEICTLPLDRILGVGWERCLAIQERESLLEEWYKELSEGRNSSHEFRFQDEDANVRWVHVRTAPLRLDSGTLIGHVGTLEDISQSKNAEARLLLYRKIFESCDDGIAITDPEGRYLEQNPAHRQITGYRDEEIKGRTPAVHFGDRAFAEMNTELLKRGAFQAEIESQTRSGEHRILDVSAFSMLNESGEVQCNVQIERDITEKKKADKALAMADKLASMGRLAATIAHEINNPLASVTNLLYLIERSSSLAEAHGYSQTAQQELRRISHICRQTLGFYRESTKPAQVNLAEVLEDVLALQQPKIAVKGIRLEKRFPADLRIVALAGEMHQVFLNLVENAIAAIDQSGGVLVVNAYESRSWKADARPGLRVVVADNGCGIDRLHRKRIFEPFFSTKGEKGTGLGLWVSYGIVQKHDGDVRVVSSTRPGRRGTCFSVFLPRQSATIKAA